jgi:hypothetical protein
MAPQYLIHPNDSTELVAYLQQKLEHQKNLKISLRYTPDTPMEFAMNESNIHGQISLLQEILDAIMLPTHPTS